MLRQLSLSIVLILLGQQLTSAQHPQTAISNDVLAAKLYLPNVETGYYRGTRFDWSGVIHSLRLDGHEYFGEWQKSDDPHLHDRITGPVNSFEVDTDIQAGETFLRIGVGICAKRKGKTKHPFEVVNHGQWKTDQGANWIQMTQVLKDEQSGYAYEYRKRITLTPGLPEMVIDHVLTNTGQERLESEVYNHNFFVMDNQPTGPDFKVEFPFELKADLDLRGIGKVEGQSLRYSREVAAGKHIYSTLSGFDPTKVEHHGFSIENSKTKMGVRMSTDRAMSSLRYWSPRTTLCPEPFITLKIEPRHSDRWATRYTFYALEEQ